MSSRVLPVLFVLSCLVVHMLAAKVKALGRKLWWRLAPWIERCGIVDVFVQVLAWE